MVKKLWHGTFHNPNGISCFISLTTKDRKDQIKEWIQKTLPKSGSSCAKRGVTIRGLPEEKIEGSTLKQDPVIITNWQDGQDYSFIQDILDKLQKINVMIVETEPTWHIGKSIYILVLA